MMNATNRCMNSLYVMHKWKRLLIPLDYFNDSYENLLWKHLKSRTIPQIFINM